MTIDELKNVKFKISNQYGSIEFLKRVDLTGVDLENDVIIKSNSAQVYGDGKDKKVIERGTKLNVPALITINLSSLKRVQNIKTQADLQKFEEYLKKNLEKKAREENDTPTTAPKHIDFDLENKIWKFKVFHFTKFGVDDDSEDELPMNDQSQVSQQEV